MDNNMSRTDDNQVEINLRGYFRLLKEKLWVLVLAAVVCAAALCGLKKMREGSHYEATSTIYLTAADQADRTGNVHNVAAGQMLIKDSLELVTNRATAQLAYEELEQSGKANGLTVESLNEMVSAESPDGTRLFKITIKGNRSVQVEAVAEAVTHAAQKILGQVPDIESTTILEKPNKAVFVSESGSYKKFGALGAVLGIILAAFVFFLRYFLNDKIQNRHSVEYYMNQDVLGIISKGQPDSTAAKEAVSALRANIQFKNDNVRTLAISSSVSGEGRSTVASLLAESYANAGKRTLLVDADLRSLSSAGMMKDLQKAEAGFGNLISIDDPNALANRAEAAIQKTENENLYVLPRGTVPDHPAETLNHDHLSALVEYLKGQFDLVIFDTPALSYVIDGAELANECDADLFLVESNRVDFRLARKNLRQIQRTKTSVVGIVLNKADLKHNVNLEEERLPD